MSAAPPVVVPQTFESALAFVFSAEGDFANDALDKGGPTRYGITQATYTEWLRRQGHSPAPVAGITREDAAAIYRTLFWQDGGCAALPSPLNAVHFDSTVQHSPASWRPMLMSAQAFEGATPEQEAFALLCLRHNFYERLAAHDQTQAKFLKGWLARLVHLRAHVGLAPAVPS